MKACAFTCLEIPLYLAAFFTFKVAHDQESNEAYRRELEGDFINAVFGVKWRG